ncbi:MAG: tetratricopeptide repeat protein, partial [Thermoanaerobaculia bacterium]|nr:tetratricopeptide repeat protein [Thermoanaerobaculia bacterium]
MRPDEPRVWNNLGIVLERLARPDQAHAAYLRALEAAPNYGPALINAALCELKNGDLERAAEHLEQASAAGFRSLQATVAEAALAARQGRKTEAEALLETARRQDPETTGKLWAELS